MAVPGHQVGTAQLRCIVSLFLSLRENNLPSNISNGPFRPLIFWIRDKHKTFSSQFACLLTWLGWKLHLNMWVLPEDGQISFSKFWVRCLNLITGTFTLPKNEHGNEKITYFHGRHIFKWLFVYCHACFRECNFQRSSLFAGFRNPFLNFGCDIDAPFGKIMELDKLRKNKFLAQDVALFCLEVPGT